MASRLLTDLDHRIQYEAGKVVEAWQEAGLDVLITCTYRSNEEQEKLYAQGRTAPGFIVTHAKAGESLHNHRLAIDFVPMVHGKPAWEDDPMFKRIAEVAMKVDPRIAWGGNWRISKRDAPHLEWSLGNLGSS
jgi:peptidoglycan L-alanyl-D-glutamate endopeptidase CwlK